MFDVKCVLGEIWVFFQCLDIPYEIVVERLREMQPWSVLRMKKGCIT